MNLLFCNEGPLFIDENGEYYGSALNEEFFKKYYEIADFITILIRVRKITKEQAKLKYTKIDTSNKKIIEIPNLMSIKGFITRFKIKKNLQETIKKNDIVVARLPSVIGNMAAKIARKNNKKYIADVVGCCWDSLSNHSLKGKIIAFPMFISQRNAVRNADYAIYVTSSFLQKRYPNKKESIAISDVLLRESSDDILENRLKRIEEKKEKIIIGTTAGINVKYKGQSNVIKAIAKLKQKGICNIEYQLVGGGDPTYLSHISKKYGVEDNIVILGAMPHDKIFYWLDSIDIYIQPSFQEGLCRALIEAMSRGLPCIVSDAGGNPELIPSLWVYNRRKSVKELVNKLEKIDSIDSKEMIKLAKDNFQRSKNYQKDILDVKRKKVYEKIKKEISIYNRI